MAEREKLDFEIQYSLIKDETGTIYGTQTMWDGISQLDKFIEKKLKAACQRIDEYEHRIQELERAIANLVPRIENVEEILGE